MVIICYLMALEFCLQWSIGQVKWKKCLWKYSECEDSDHPVHAQSIIKAFALHGCTGWSRPSLSAYAPRHVFPWHGPNTVSILTHCIQTRLSHTTYWKSPISILGMSCYEICIFLEKMAKPFANRGDPDQTPHSAASDVGLHCLPITLLRVSRLQWVK